MWWVKTKTKINPKKKKTKNKNRKTVPVRKYRNIFRDLNRILEDFIQWRHLYEANSDNNQSFQSSADYDWANEVGELP